MWKTTSRDSRFEHEGVCISPAGRRRQSRQFSAPRGSSLRCAKHHTSSKIRGSQRRRLSTHTMTTSLTRTLVFESWRWRKAAVKKRKKQRMLWQRKQKISVTPDHTLQLFLRWLELWWYNAKQSWKSAKRNECFGSQKNKINRFTSDCRPCSFFSVRNLCFNKLRNLDSTQPLSTLYILPASGQATATAAAAAVHRHPSKSSQGLTLSYPSDKKYKDHLHINM